MISVMWSDLRVLWPFLQQHCQWVIGLKFPDLGRLGEKRRRDELPLDESHSCPLGGRFTPPHADMA